MVSPVERYRAVYSPKLGNKYKVKPKAFMVLRLDKTSSSRQAEYLSTLSIEGNTLEKVVVRLGMWMSG